MRPQGSRDRHGARTTSSPWSQLCLPGWRHDQGCLCSGEAGPSLGELRRRRRNCCCPQAVPASPGTSAPRCGCSELRTGLATQGTAAGPRKAGGKEPKREEMGLHQDGGPWARRPGRKGRVDGVLGRAGPKVCSRRARCSTRNRSLTLSSEPSLPREGPALWHLELREKSLGPSSCSLKLSSVLKERALRDRMASSQCPDSPTQESVRVMPREVPPARSRRPEPQAPDPSGPPVSQS